MNKVQLYFSNMCPIRRDRIKRNIRAFLPQIEKWEFESKEYDIIVREKVERRQREGKVKEWLKSERR